MTTDVPATIDCSTIVVSYNTFELTRTAVQTALDAADDLDHEVIVVDNASPDQSAARLAEAFVGDGRVLVIARYDNAGFAAANNRGADRARGRVLYFLNPDTASHDHSVATLVRFVDAHPEAGAVGPRVLHADGTDQPTATRFDTAWTLLRNYFPVGGDSFTRRHPTATAPTDVVNGCALAISRAAFDRVGGWDERYFMYAEEHELCWQLRDAGYTSYYLREATVTHLGGQSGLDRYAEQQVLNAQSGLAFLRRHHPPHVVWANRIGGALGYAIRDGAFSAMARLRPTRAEEYRRRRDAARALWRWYTLVHA